jgi:hypothetical protein
MTLPLYVVGQLWAFDRVRATGYVFLTDVRI